MSGFVYLGLVVALLPVARDRRRARRDRRRGEQPLPRPGDLRQRVTLVNGEDVKVAGAPVGVISAMDVTPDKKAALTLRIDDDAFTPFKKDASCTIRLQGLIGEQFVECEPGTAGSPALAKIQDGDGEGEHLLPVANTSSPVDLDLLNDILRLPYRQRFAILINEFGTGLAGRGKELNEVIHRANPALRETDKVLAILAGQNRELARLARTRTRRSRRSRASASTSRTSSWPQTRPARPRPSAARDIALGIHRCPTSCASSAADGGPRDCDRPGHAAAHDLGAAAPDLGRLIKAQGTLADACRDAFPSLGDALERGRPGADRRAAADPGPRRLGEQLAPVSVNLDDLTKSLDKTGAVERINDTLYYVALTTNGFDSLSHYLRTGLVTNTLHGVRDRSHGRRLHRELHERHSSPPRRTPSRAGRPRPCRTRARRAATSRRRAPCCATCSRRPHGSAAGPRARGQSARAAQARDAGLSGPRLARAHARLPARRLAVRGRPGGALTASPVLVGAVTVLVTIVAVFLSYNATSGLPFVPTYDLKANLPNAAQLVKGFEVRIGGARVGLIVEDRAAAARRRTDLRADHDEARQVDRAAAGRLDAARPPALRARPQVRRARARASGEDARDRLDDPGPPGDARRPSSSTSSSTCSTRRPASASATRSTASAAASPAAART